MKYLHKLCVLLSLAFLLLAIVVMMLNPTASGYELSLYAAYPVYFFVLLILAYVISTLSVLYCVFYGKVNKLTSVNVFVIMAINFILLFQPYIRGYALFQREDAMTHLGYVKDILLTSHTGRSNFYPFIHVESAGLQLLSGLDVMFIRELLPYICYLLYIFFIYLLVSAVIKDKKYGLLSLLFASVPFMSDCLNNFTSSGTLFFLIPLILYILYRHISRFSFATGLLSLILVLAVPFMHPEFAFLLILIALVLVVTLHFHRSGETHVSAPGESLLAIISFISIVFLSWILNFRQFSIYIMIFYGIILKFFTGSSAVTGASPVTAYSSMLSKSQIVIVDLIRLFFTLYGPVLIFILLGLFFFLMLSYHFYKTKKYDIYIISFMSLYALMSIFTIVLIVMPLIITYNRMLKYVLLLSVILISIGFVYAIKKREARKNVFFSAIVVILSISMLLSMFNLYPSPIIYSYNYQVTHMELAGAGWFLDHGNKNVLPVYVFYTFGRFANEIQGCEQSKYSNYNYSIISINSLPPDHFNYHNKPYLGDTYPNDRYIFINQLTRAFYLELWPTINRFNAGDFYRLDHDTSVSSVYTNGELDIYRI